MGFTRAEFLRLLPAAMRLYPYTLAGDCIRVTVNGRLLRITLGEEQVRRIAALALPWLPVEFDYAQLDEATFQTFLQHFDLYYRKGGG